MNSREAKEYFVELASILDQLGQAGIVSHRAVAKELNRREVPTVRGGHWDPTTVQRVIARLGMSGNRGRGPEANARDADRRAEVLGATITKFRAQGISTMAITRELNALGIPGPTGGPWYRTTVHRLLKRLKRIEKLQRFQVGRATERRSESCECPLRAAMSICSAHAVTLSIANSAVP